MAFPLNNLFSADNCGRLFGVTSDLIVTTVADQGHIQKLQRLKDTNRASSRASILVSISPIYALSHGLTVTHSNFNSGGLTDDTLLKRSCALNNSCVWCKYLANQADS